MGVVGVVLRVEFIFTQVEFGADDVSAVAKAFETLLGVPVEKAGEVLKAGQVVYLPALNLLAGITLAA